MPQPPAQDTPARAVSFDVEGFVYALRFFALVFTLITIIVTAPTQVPLALAHALNTQSQEARIATLDEQLGVLKIQRVQKNRERMLALLQEYSQKHTLRTIDTQSETALAGAYDKLIAADLENMTLYLYEHGQVVSMLPIASKGKVGSRWQTPTGLYNVQTKETDHFSSIGEVHMPYSMQFFGNFFIHGWPYYPGGKEVARGFSGGCIRLETADAKEVFNFAEYNTPVFVYETTKKNSTPITITNTERPANITAQAYLLADIHTGRVYFEQNASTIRPIASVAKLMTALVANETIHYDKVLTIKQSDAQKQQDFGTLTPGASMSVGDAFYPLLMESNNSVAHALSRHYGTTSFMQKMNEKAKAIGAHTLTFADASGISAQDLGTAEDVFKLGRYVYNNQSFILNISKKQSHTIDYHVFKNFNHFSNRSDFVGGKNGYTTAAGETMLAVFDVSVGNTTTTVAAVVLGSKDRKQDIEHLVEHFAKVAVVDTSHFAQNSTLPAAALYSAIDQSTMLPTLRVIEE